MPNKIMQLRYGLPHTTIFLNIHKTKINHNK